MCPRISQVALVSQKILLHRLELPVTIVLPSRRFAPPCGCAPKGIRHSKSSCVLRTLKKADLPV
jgi:hypothetical protein